MTRCQIFRGYISPSGYGLLRVDGRLCYAHRAAWEQAHGPINPDQHVLHRCENRACVRPSHLYLGRATDQRKFAYGEKSGSAKLNADQVRQIRRSYAPQSVLAVRYGVSQSNGCAIVNRKTWRHIL